MSQDLKTSMNYVENPPRCFNCIHRFTERTSPSGMKVRVLMCALSQQTVRSSAVCDSWCGYKGEKVGFRHVRKPATPPKEVPHG